MDDPAARRRVRASAQSPYVRRSFATITTGAALLIVSVAGFIVVPEHAPGVEQVGRDQFGNCQAIGETGNTCHYVATGLAHTPYDALRITTWSLLIVGVVLTAIGLIGFARR
jgi:hypothetical protein